MQLVRRNLHDGCLRFYCQLVYALTQYVQSLDFDDPQDDSFFAKQELTGLYIQDGFAIAVAGIKRVGIYVGFQPICDLIHDGASWLAGASQEAR